MKVANGEVEVSKDRYTIAIGVSFLVFAILTAVVGLQMWFSPVFLMGILILVVSFCLGYWGLYLVTEGGGFNTPFWTREVRWEDGRIRMVGGDEEGTPYYMREPLDQEHLIPSERPVPSVGSRTMAVIRIGGISMVLAGVYSGGFGLVMVMVPPGFILTPSYLVLGILSCYYGIRFLQRKHRIRIGMVLILLMAGNGFILYLFEGALGWMGTALSIVGITSLTLSWKYLR